MNQRCNPAPVLIRRVGEKDSGHNLIRRCTLEESPVGERRYICGKEDRRGRLRIARGLGKTVVEAAAASPGYVGEHTIQGHSSVLIRIESLVKEIAQEAPVLRNSLAVNPLCRSDRFGIVLGVGSEVADSGEAPSGDHGVSYHIHVFVNFSRLKAAIQMNEPVCRNELAIDGMRELPLRARDDRPPPVARVANSQHIVWIVRRGYRIFDSAYVALNKVTERNRLHLLWKHEVAAQQAGDGLAVLFCQGSKKSQSAFALRVPLPTKRHHGVAVAQ